MSTTEFSVTSSYEDIVDTIAAAASVDVGIQNVGPNNVSLVAQDSGSAPAADALGIVLKPLDAVIVNAAELHVKALGPSGKVVVSTKVK